MLITKPSLIKAINTLFFETNQIMKNGSENSCYTIRKGICYSFSSFNEKSVHKKMIIKERKDKELNEFITKINGYFNGVEAFRFFNEYKKNITTVELEDDYFQINTSIPELIYRSESFEKNRKNDYDSIIRYKKELKTRINEEPHEVFKLTEDEVTSVVKAKFPTILKREIVDHLTKFIAFNIAANKLCKISTYRFKKKTDGNFFYSKIVINDSKYKTESYLVFINYERS